MKSTLAAALGLLLAAGTLPAQGPARGAPGAPPPSGNGEIKGTIVDLKSSAPVARASVSVRAKASGALVAGAIAGPTALPRSGTSSRHLLVARHVHRLRAADAGRRHRARQADRRPRHGAALARRRHARRGRRRREAGAVTIEPDRNAYRAKDVAPAAANASELLEPRPPSRRRRRQGQSPRQRERRRPDQRPPDADPRNAARVVPQEPARRTSSTASRSFRIRRRSTIPKAWPASSTSRSSRTSTSA